MNNKPMNLIVLCSDEMRGDCLGIMGNPDVKSPNLDRFGQNSVVFNNHFTCHGKCVPARIAFMTGRYSHTDGYRDIYNHMPPETPDMLFTLKNLGYQSAVFGKNHCWETMFDGYIDYHSWMGHYKEYYEEQKKIMQQYVRKEVRPSMELEDGFDYAGEAEIHTDAIYTDQAIDFLTKTRDKSRPFFLQVNIEAPHTKYGAPEPCFSMYDPEKITPFPYKLPENASLPLVKMREVRTGLEDNERAFREVQATYYSMITKVDHHMGQLLETIEREGLMENSVIIFWVDHGDFAGQYGLVEKWDTCMNDCIMHVPCMLHAPGLPKGLRIDSLTSTVDLAPTILDIMGLEHFRGIHGKSLLPVLNGQELVRNAVFGDGGHEDEMLGRFNRELMTRGNCRQAKQETYAKYPDTMARTKMVRTDRYKLVMRLRGGNELFDMKEDPYEMNNLWGRPEYNAVVMELMHMLIEWCLETDTDRPHNPIVGA